MAATATATAQKQQQKQQQTQQQKQKEKQKLDELVSREYRCDTDVRLTDLQPYRQ